MLKLIRLLFAIVLAGGAVLVATSSLAAAAPMSANSSTSSPRVLPPISQQQANALATETMNVMRQHEAAMGESIASHGATVGIIEPLITHPINTWFYMTTWFGCIAYTEFGEIYGTAYAQAYVYGIQTCAMSVEAVGVYGGTIYNAQSALVYGNGAYAAAQIEYATILGEYVTVCSKLAPYCGVFSASI